MKIKKEQLWQEHRSGEVFEIVSVCKNIVRIKSIATGKLSEAYLDRFGGKLAMDFWLKRDVT